MFKPHSPFGVRELYRFAVIIIEIEEVSSVGESSRRHDPVEASGIFH